MSFKIHFNKDNNILNHTEGSLQYFMLSDQLSKMGITGWFGEKLQKGVSGLSWVSVFVLVSLFYFYAHYFFRHLWRQKKKLRHGPKQPAHLAGPGNDVGWQTLR